MSVRDTVLIYAGIPAAVVLIIAVLAFAGGGRRPRRYRPGRPFNFAPVWFLAAPERVTGEPDTAQLPAKEGRPALAAGQVEIKAASRPGQTGGASDRW